MSRKLLQPYKHDCDKCIWVAWIHVKGGGKFGNDWGNMYFCPNPSDGEPKNLSPGSVIIRFSDTPDDYWSSPIGFGVPGPLSLRPADTE